ncbi:MAG TPA: EpsI family protein [Candidatus Limnocylindria bacterium]|nr:EpsI family protein [Candidatus Limnocylindria bacterium]
MIRWLMTLLLLAGTAAFVVLNPPANLALGGGVLAACPTRFGDWNGTDLSFEDAVVEELKADDLLIRRYQRGEDRVWLCVVYHRHRRYGAHDPKLCYESSGYVLERVGRWRVEDGSAAGLTVNRFVVDRTRDRRVVYHWWTTRGLATADAGAYRRNMAFAGALDGRSWGAFVRVEAQVRDGDDAAADRIATDFASRVARDLPGVFAQAEVASAREPQSR